MPTGYTDLLYNEETGKKATLKDFVLRCAHGFLGEMYDRSLDTPIELELPPDGGYHTERLAEAYKDKTEFESLTKVQVERRANADYRKERKDLFETIKRRDALRKRYEGMLAKVREWEPPTEEHEGLKNYMVEQLEGSIEHDCDVSYFQERLEELVMPTPEQFKQRKLDRFDSDIKYYEEQVIKEIERTRQRNAWVKALFESLGDAS